MRSEAKAVLSDSEASKSDVLNAAVHMLSAKDAIDSVLYISSAEQWNAFASSVNSGNGYGGKIVKLSSDIDFSDAEFIPAGTQSCPFDGIFDGQGYIMSSISCNADYSGVFGRISKKSTVKNLVVSDSEFSGKYAGGICAMLDSVQSRIAVSTEQSVRIYTEAELRIYERRKYYKQLRLCGYRYTVNGFRNCKIRFVGRNLQEDL